MKNIINWRSSRTRMFMLFIVDVLTIVVNAYLSLIIRHELHYSWIPQEYINSIKSYMLINIITTIVIFILMKLYKSVWSFASVHEFTLIFGACILSAAIQALGMQFLVLKVPRSYYIFYFFLLLMTTTVTRFSYRGLRIVMHGLNRPEERILNTMVIGAGEAGSMIIHELKFSKHLYRKGVCVIDNPSKKGKYLHGVPIVGNKDTIIEKAKEYNVDEIVLAIPSAGTKVTRDILRICNQTECKLKVLPGMYQFITEEVSVSKLREVSIEDLLGRDAIDIDLDSVLGYVKGKTVLVTGGGGSIGSELCRQVAKYNPKCLIIFDIYENNAYDIQQELKKKYPDLDLVVLVGSIRDSRRINSVFATYRPEVVYHAAAHKHVPLMEDSPCESIKNNAIGTYKTAYAAMMNGCQRFVLISTDKAVNPTNIMGASKRLCEMIIQSFDRMIKEGTPEKLPILYAHADDEDGAMVQQEFPKDIKTEFVAVRFGNVLGSNGSVIPLFKKQIEAGGPVTVTHPDIIRYFMTIPEAVSLVLQAGTYAHGGEIFVLDMGSPVKIDTLARNLIKLSGLKPDVDIKVEYTGLRPGEKLYEEKLMAEEGLKKTRNELIHIGCPIPFEIETFLKELESLMDMAYTNVENIREKVAEVVTTYHPAGEHGSEKKGEVYERLLGEESA